MKTRVLVVDDEPQSLKYLRVNLVGRGYEVLTRADGESALEQLEAEQFDLVILDLGLPGIDGFAVLERLRAYSDTPVVVLTARDSDADKIRALDLGADDYLVKPFSVGELLARMRAVLRRVGSRGAGGASARPPLAVGDLRVDFGRRKVSLMGRDVRLTPTEYGLLEQLALHPGRVLTHAMLLERVWGPEYRHETHYLYSYLGRLRQKLEPDAAVPRYLLTEPGVGYRLVEA